MIVGIINFECSNNYGAVLQCLALQNVLEKNGNEAVVINYCPRYLIEQQTAFPNPFFFAKWAAHENAKSNIEKIKKIIKRSGHAILKYKDSSVRMKRCKAFDSYRRKYLNLTRSYETYESLFNDPPVCDIYVTGSDQVWNPRVTYSQLDEAFFLGFASNKKKVAYSASPCQLDVNEYKEQLKSYLSSFSYISVREKEKLSDLQCIVDIPIKQCLDPTLLLNAQDYLQYEESICETPDNYILVYGFSDKDNLCKNTVNYVKKVLNIPVIDISFDRITNRDSKWEGCISPGQFLSYIKNATYIVTNSFHGTVFSVLYKKQFICITKKVTASRVTELLAGLYLDDRIVESFEPQCIQRCIDRTIDFEKTFRILQDKRRRSMEFIETAIR